MTFERFLKSFLEMAQITGWLGAIILGAYVLGYALFVGVPPLGAQIGCVATTFMWVCASEAHRMIFEPRTP